MLKNVRDSEDLDDDLVQRNLAKQDRYFERKVEIRREEELDFPSIEVPAPLVDTRAPGT